MSALIVTPALASDNPLSSLKKDFLKGYKLTQQGKPEKAISPLEKVRDTGAAVRDYVLYSLGRAYLAAKRCDAARRTFSELAENYPDSRWFFAADAQARSEEACPALQGPTVVEPAPPDCDALSDERARADCWFGARLYRKAKEVYRKLPPEPEVLVKLSQASARTQDFETAIEANQNLRKLFPKSKEAAEAERKIAFLRQDSGDYAGAIKILQPLAVKAKVRSEKRLFYERLGWCHFRLEQYAQAVDRYGDAIAQEETPRSLYWKGRSLERLGRNDEAEAVFQEVARTYGASYYAIRSVERLGSRLHGGKTSVEATLQSWWSRISPGIAWDDWTMTAEESRDLDRVYELTVLGLLEDAGVELRRARQRLHLVLPPDPKKIRRLDDGRFVYAVRNPRQEDADYRIPYADHLLTAFKNDPVPGFDPLLLFGMMRQESRFKESIVSPAGAIGLLQIMPATGRKLARDAGWEEYYPEWLYDPFTNIDLAVRYVKKLSGDFEGRWFAVAASYNAGEQVVGEWLKRRKNLLEEEFIEEIPYQETRDYVMKVYTNWKAYQVIYGPVEKAS
ncbi:MAG TPA: transglycosylase SLT domain-containing protein [bacterium]|nr:transglycosylase SLT domain-containing protein [bacterium]